MVVLTFEFSKTKSLLLLNCDQTCWLFYLSFMFKQKFFCILEVMYFIIIKSHLGYCIFILVYAKLLSINFMPE